jgi:hypothetical protein
MPISDGSFQKLLKFESTIITGAKRKWSSDFIVDETLGGLKD